MDHAVETRYERRANTETMPRCAEPTSPSRIRRALGFAIEFLIAAVIALVIGVVLVDVVTWCLIEFYINPYHVFEFM